MGYKKVFSSTRFHTRAQNSFTIDSKRKAITVGIRADQSPRSAYIGKINEQGRVTSLLDYEVFCDTSFPHVIGIFGSRGSGKSFDLGVILEGIFAETASVNDAGLIFDVQDQFWTLAYEPSPTLEADAVQLKEIERWGLTPSSVAGVKVYVPAKSDTQVPGAETFSLAAAQLSSADWLAILELERFSAMGQALLTLLELDNPRPPEALAAACELNPALAGFQQASIDGLRWRLDSLSTTGIITDSGVSLDALLTPGILSVVLMRNLSDSVRGLIVGVLARSCLDRMGRVRRGRKVAMRTGLSSEDMPKLTNRFWMVLDEAHILVPSDGATAASGPLVDYVKRGRDAGLSLIFATQQPSAVDSRLMSQVDMTFTHMLGFESDLNAAVSRMPTRTSVEYEVDNHKASSIADVIRSLGPGEAVVADNASGRAFLIKIRPRLSAHGGATPK